MYRYAVYYAPPADHPLARLAAAWLGRCPEGGAVPPRPAVAGFADDALDRVVAEPARYGFHGTLKPPFRLRQGHRPEELHERLADLAQALHPFELPPLGVTAIGRFLAIVPRTAAPILDAVAAACVTGLDLLRAVPTVAELARRRQAPLDRRQEALLDRWGYPHVLDRFRFHLTLTGPLSIEDQAALQPVLAERTAPVLAAPLPFADLALFVEPEAGQPFRLERRFPLAAK